MTSVSCCSRLLPAQPRKLHRDSVTSLPRSHYFLSSPHLRLNSPNATISRIRCCRNPYSNSGRNESKAVLDAFFLGKAFAEALTERVGSAVGEFLSVVGQLQAEQQKKVQDFQEEVLERAQKAREKASREAMASQASTTMPSAASSSTENLTLPSVPGAAEPIDDQA